MSRPVWCRFWPRFWPRFFGALLLAAGAVGASAWAAPFEIAVAPSRLELSAKGTQRVGRSLQIHNLGLSATDVAVRTLDWTLSSDGRLNMHDELLPGSCRPWVTLERRAVRVLPRSQAQFRFQIDVPVDAPRGEGRFMIAIEGIEPAHQSVLEGGGASLNLPVSGRIAVAVYVAVNGAKPKLTLQTLDTVTSGGQRLPRVVLHNSGEAHGRLEGSLDATDATGRVFELQPDGGPVLPGQTRSLLLQPRSEDGKPLRNLSYPLRLKGTLEWSDGGFKWDTQLP